MLRLPAPRSVLDSGSGGGSGGARDDCCGRGGGCEGRTHVGDPRGCCRGAGGIGGGTGACAGGDGPHGFRGAEGGRVGASADGGGGSDDGSCEVGDDCECRAGSSPDADSRCDHGGMENGASRGLWPYTSFTRRIWLAGILPPPRMHSIPRRGGTGSGLAAVAMVAVAMAAVVTAAVGPMAVATMAAGGAA